MPKKSLGFALGSGGSRGVAHIGFLKATEENGIVPDYIAGCSMGSVVGAGYALGLTPEKMFEAVDSLRPFDLLSVNRQRGGVFSSEKMRKTLEKYLGDKDFSQLKIPFSCVAVDLKVQEVVTFSSGSILDAIVASSTIPAIFKPFIIGDKKFVDGGVLERIPARLVKDMGAEQVVAVDVLGQRPCGKEGISTLGALMEIIDLMDNFRTRKRREENEGIIDLWIEPDLGDMNPYTFKKMAFAYEKGYFTGVEYVPKIKKLQKR